MIEHIEPKATADGVAVYCGGQSEKSEQAPEGTDNRIG